MAGRQLFAIANFTAVALVLHYAIQAWAASYAVTLNRVVSSIGDFDCGQLDDSGNARNFCIVCAPTGGVRAVAAACDAVPGCVAFDIQRAAGRCAYLKSMVPLPEHMQLKPGFTHYCKLDGSGRCRAGEFLWKPGVSIPTIAGNDMSCAATPTQPLSPFCAQCHNHTMNITRGMCSVCGVDRMLLSCTANPACAAIEYVQSDSCGRVKVAAGPMVVAEEMNTYIKIGASAAVAAHGPSAARVPLTGGK